MSFHTKPTGPQPLLDRETLAERADAMLLPQASSLASAYRAWRERAQRARPVADADEHDATAQGAAWLVAVDEEFESYVVHPGDRDGEEPRFACSLRKALRFVGPSWVVMVPYVQPLEAAELGAYTGHALLWLLLLTALVRLGLQEAAARVGVVSGRGLAHAAASSLGYPRWVRGVLFSGLTLAVVGASVRSLIAGATALHTLSAGALPPMAGSAIVAADALVLLGLHDLGVRGFEAAVGAAFATGAICAIITAAAAETSTADVVVGVVVPGVPPNAVTSALQALGGAAAPHLLVLHSTTVLTRQVNRRSAAKTHEAVWYYRLEAAAACALALAAQLTIVAAFDSALGDGACAALNQTGAPFACLATNQTGGSSASSALTDTPCTPKLRPNHPGLCGRLDLDAQAAGDALSSAIPIGEVPTVTRAWAVALLAVCHASLVAAASSAGPIATGLLGRAASYYPYPRVSAIAAALAVALVVFGAGTIEARAPLQAINVVEAALLPFAAMPLLLFCRASHLGPRFGAGRRRLAALALLAALPTVAALASACVLLATAVTDDFTGEVTSPLAIAVFAVLALAYLGFVVRLALPARRKQDVEGAPPELRRRSTFDLDPLTMPPTVRPTTASTLVDGGSARTTAEPPPADADAEGEGGGGERLSLDLQLGGEGAEVEGAVDAPEAAD